MTPAAGIRRRRRPRPRRRRWRRAASIRSAGDPGPGPRATSSASGAVDGFEAIAGGGVDGSGRDGRRARATSSSGVRRLLRERGVDLTSLDAAATIRPPPRVGPCAYVAVDGGVAGLIVISDPVKAEAADGGRRPRRAPASRSGS